MVKPVNPDPNSVPTVLCEIGRQHIVHRHIGLADGHDLALKINPFLKELPDRFMRNAKSLDEFKALFNQLKAVYTLIARSTDPEVSIMDETMPEQLRLQKNKLMDRVAILFCEHSVSNIDERMGDLASAFHDAAEELRARPELDPSLDITANAAKLPKWYPLK